MEQPRDSQSRQNEPRVLDVITFTAAELCATYCVTRIIDLAQTHPPEWEAAICGIGVLALTASGAAANRWILITRSRITGLPRS